MGKLIEKEGRFYKECGVVMLATTNKAQIHSVVGKNKFTYSFKNDIMICANKKMKRYHLYITSDDEIKEGDWYLFNGTIFQCTIDNWEIKDRDTTNCKKIIATTDPSLGLPQPSDKFIRAYIEAYNKGEKIEKVLVEYSVNRRCVKCKSPYLVYVCTCGEQDNFEYFNFTKLKDNNNIIIKKVKDSWTRDEVIKLLKFFTENTRGNSPWMPADDEWVEENL